jgi:hypothetical protein
MASVVELLAHLNNVFENQRGFFIEIDEYLCNYLSINFQSLNVNDDINKYKMNLEYDIQDGTIRMLFYSDPLKKLIGRESNEFIFLEDFRKLVLSIVNRI